MSAAHGTATQTIPRLLKLRLPFPKSILHFLLKARRYFESKRVNRNIGLKGNWSRTENFILDRDHIRFEEYESSDEGKTWTKTNSGTEERTAP